MAKIKYKSTEKSTQHAVMQYLSLMGILHWRNQSGTIFRDLGYKKSVIRMGIAGSPDVYALRAGTLYGLEIKDAKGRQNDNQIAFEKRFTASGGKYYVIRDVSEVEAIFGKLHVVVAAPQPRELPSCGHRLVAHYHAPSGRTLCIKCIEKIEI